MSERSGTMIFEPDSTIAGRSGDGSAVSITFSHFSPYSAVGVETQQERRVDVALAVLAAFADALAVDEQRDRPAEVVAPVVAGHLPPVRGEPGEVLQRVAA